MIRTPFLYILYYELPLTFHPVCSGAVVPLSDQDALVDLFNSFMASPDQFTSALGFQRTKRSACDKVRQPSAH